MILMNKIVTLNSEEKDLINFFESDNFPLYYAETTSPNFHQYGHGFVKRYLENEIEGGIINSDYCSPAMSIFERICNENNIRYDKIYRSCLNSTSYYPNLHGDIHTDHTFEHYIFLLYLNDFDYGNTYLFDDNHNMIDIIKPDKNRCVIFKGCPHAQGFCSPAQRRIVFVTTFGMRND